MGCCQVRLLPPICKFAREGLFCWSSFFPFTFAAEGDREQGQNHVTTDNCLNMRIEAMGFYCTMWIRRTPAPLEGDSLYRLLCCCRSNVARVPHLVAPRVRTKMSFCRKFTTVMLLGSMGVAGVSIYDDYLIFEQCSKWVRTLLYTTFSCLWIWPIWVVVAIHGVQNSWTDRRSSSVWITIVVFSWLSMQHLGVLFAQESDGESHYWYSVEGYSRWTHTTGAMVRGYHGGGPWRTFSFLQLPGNWQLGQRQSASSGCSVWRYVSTYLSKSWHMIWSSKQSVPATIDHHSSRALRSAVSVGKIYLHSRLKPR